MSGISVSTKTNPAKLQNSIRASVSVPILTSLAANVQILPVAVMFRYRTFQKSLFPSRPARCYSSLFRNAKYKDIIMQSRKLLKEQLIYTRDKRNGEVKNR